MWISLWRQTSEQQNPAPFSSVLVLPILAARWTHLEEVMLWSLYILAHENQFRKFQKFCEPLVERPIIKN